MDSRPFSADLLALRKTNDILRIMILNHNSLTFKDHEVLTRIIIRIIVHYGNIR